MKQSTISPFRPGRGGRLLRLAAVLVLGGLIAFAFGLGSGIGRARHPTTGRPIAGLATDAAWMDRPARAAEEAPDLALSLIGIAPGQSVADIGAGTGYMTLRLSRLVGPQGRVYANDVQPALLTVLRDKIARDHLTNVDVVLGSERDVGLPDATIDLALLVDVYHELTKPQDVLRSIRRALKPHARLVLVEYRGETPTLPIAPEHRLSVAVARQEIEAEGYVFAEAIERLPRQHILVFRRTP